MKVLWFVNRATPHRSRTLDYLCDHGVDLIAIYREGGDGGRGWGEHCFKHPAVQLEGNRLQRLVRLVRVTYASNPDIVVIMGYSTPEHVVIWLVGRLKRWRLVTRSDSNLLDHALNSPLKRFFKRIFVRAIIPRKTTVLTIGTQNANYWNLLGYRKHLLIPYRSAPFVTSSALSSMGASGGQVDVRRKVDLLFVGRLSQEKGIRELLDAYPRLVRQFPERAFDLWIVGGGPLAPEVELSTLQNPTIHYLGALPREEVGRHMLKASLVVLPSRREPWNLVVNEAISLGVPVACSWITGAGHDLPVTTNSLKNDPDLLARGLAEVIDGGWIPRPEPLPDHTGPLLKAAFTEVLRES